MVGGGGASGGDFDALLAQRGEELGFRGLIRNGKCLALAAFASLGGVLYGYNQGVFGQVQVMASFTARYESTLTNSTTKGLLTSILELGAFFGSLIAGPLADRYSRKYSISGWSIIFLIGTAVQVGANSDVGCIYAGRFVGGLGIGALSMLVPMFNAELAPPGIRGSLVALQQLAITFGILVSYWIGYGTNYIGGTGAGQSNAAWRLPLGIQMVPAVVLVVGAYFLPFSPRWLMLRGRHEECLTTLAFLRSRSVDDPFVQYEFKALQAERLVEVEAAKERYGIETVNLRVSLLEYKRLFTTRSLLRRLMLGAGAQGLQQWTGINAIIYYAPTIFQEIGLTGGTISLLATGVVGIVNFVMTFPAVFFVDNIGRRPMLAWGEANMAISHATVAAIIAVYGNSFPTHKSAGNGAVFMIYWYIANFAVTWGPLAWVVSAEVFPLDMRARGMSISSATNWIMNFTVAMTTPVMITNIGYKTYIVFMTFCIVGFFYSIFILPELRGLSLEEVDNIFHDTSGQEDAARRERVAKQLGLDKVATELTHHDARGTEAAEGKAAMMGGSTVGGGIQEKRAHGDVMDEHIPDTGSNLNGTAGPVIPGGGSVIGSNVGTNVGNNRRAGTGGSVVGSNLGGVNNNNNNNNNNSETAKSGSVIGSTMAPRKKGGSVIGSALSGNRRQRAAGSEVGSTVNLDN